MPTDRCPHTDAAARLRVAALQAAREFALTRLAGTASVEWRQESCHCGAPLARGVRCVGARISEQEGTISVCARCVNPAVTRGPSVSHGLCGKHHAEDMALLKRQGDSNG